jgi:septum formation protein
VLSADTTVALGGKLLGKPADAAEAASMLARLSGRTHRVLTAVAVGDARHTDWVVQVSRVSFARLSAAEIDTYVAGGEPFDKARHGIKGAARLRAKNRRQPLRYRVCPSRDQPAGPKGPGRFGSASAGN